MMIPALHPELRGMSKYTDAPTENALLGDLTIGDTTAFELLYDQYSSSAYGLAYRILGESDAAEDVVQEAFLTVWRQAATYDGARGSAHRWLLSIVHHRAIDYARHRGYRREHQQALDAAELLPDSVDTWEQACQTIEGRQVRAALLQLPPEQQRALTLAYFGGYTHHEIAGLTGTPLGTVKGRLRGGLQRMRSCLAADAVGGQYSPPHGMA